MEYTLQEIKKLDPDSVTVHSLAVKRAARLNMFKDQYKEMSFINNMEIMDMTEKACMSSGLFPYYLYPPEKHGRQPGERGLCPPREKKASTTS